MEVTEHCLNHKGESFAGIRGFISATTIAKKWASRSNSWANHVEALTTEQTKEQMQVVNSRLRGPRRERHSDRLTLALANFETKLEQSRELAISREQRLRIAQLIDALALIAASPSSEVNRAFRTPSRETTQTNLPT